MKLKAIFFVFTVCIAANVSAFKACDVESSITAFMNELVGCNSIEVATEKLSLVSDVNRDYSKMGPRIISDDVQAQVVVKGCGIDGKYFFWLRETDNDYKVVSYTSFSQPE